MFGHIFVTPTRWEGTVIPPSEHVPMRNGLPLSVPVAVLVAALGNSAFAAVAITSQAVTADGKSSQHTIYVTPDRAKFDMDRIAVIIRTDTGKMVNLMKERHEYMEIDPKQIGARMADAQAQMQQRLQSMPEAQRKQIEAMMAQHGMPGAPAPGAAAPAPATTSYEKAGQTKTVGAWSCQVFHYKKNGELAADLCIAPTAAVGLTKDDLAAFHTIAETVGKMLPAGGSRDNAMMDFDAMTRQIGFVGMPVETVTYLGGKVFTTAVVKSVDHAPLAPDLFEVPAGYTKREMPGPAGPGPDRPPGAAPAPK
jgi:hypothetical protein